jgi:hypothetical protein
MLGHALLSLLAVAAIVVVVLWVMKALGQLR